MAQGGAGDDPQAIEQGREEGGWPMIQPLLEKIRPAVSGEEALAHVHRLCQFRREVFSPGYRQAAEYCCQVIREVGLEEVELLEYPADGETKYGDYVMPRVWNLKEAELTVITPVETPKLLARYSDCPASVLSGCLGTTPRSGVEAEVVLVPNGTHEENYAGVDVAGKIVFTHQLARSVKNLAVPRGALGIISDAFRRFPPVRGAEDLNDAVQWHFFWGHKDEPMCPAFSLSPNQGKWLEALLRRAEAQGEKVKVLARVDAEVYDSVGEVSTGVIPGSAADAEEVLLLAHLTEPGANDNASGCAALLEAARCLCKLISEGVLPPPKRNIRLVFVYEFYGTAAYLANNPERVARTVAALNIDTVGGDERQCGGTLFVLRTHPAAPTFSNDLLEAILEALVAEYSDRIGIVPGPMALFRWGVAAGAGGDSRTLSEWGLPAPMVTQWPDKFYHTSADTPDKIDPMMLARASMLVATFAYFVAQAGAREALWLAHEITARAKRRIIAQAQEAITKRLSAWGKTTGQDESSGAESLEALAAREADALRSVERLIDNAGVCKA